ncbi:MAG: MOSC domain-containing protein [Candidatus Obscuribacterales bacterium]|nr:MOSC domain-containing protein [Candidatus Obscuribacterales bacterium]
MKVPSVLQVNVSLPTIVNFNGNKIETGIFKKPVSGKVKVRRLNLEGDAQADLTVHGGPDKAVYAYPLEQYDYWKTELSNSNLEWGVFGENLTVEGFDENNVCIGDRMKIGSAMFAVTQPRMPCFKLGIRFGDPTIVKRFYKSGKWGFYLSVLEEGEIETGDEIFVADRLSDISLADVSRCFLDPSVDSSLLAKVRKSELAQQMKEQLEYQLGRH